MNYQDDLFEARVAVLAEQKAKELLNDSRFVMPYLINRVADLERELQLAGPKASKWDKYLDSEGYLDVAEIADKIGVIYIPPNGKPRNMGRNHFCQLLVHDRIITSSSNGYRLHSAHRDRLQSLAKVFTKPIGDDGRIRSSVKFNTKGLDWLDTRYSNDNRVWRSTSASELYHE